MRSLNKEELNCLLCIEQDDIDDDDDDDDDDDCFAKAGKAGF